MGGFSSDLFLLLLPGFIGIVVFFIFPTNPTFLIFYAFLASTMVNAGHVYTTLWRTIFRKEERQAHPIYWATPAAITVLVFFWVIFKIPHLWTFVVYATAYHQAAQFYGFLKWYEKLNKKSSRFSGMILWGLMLTPFILFHFRSLGPMGFYTSQDILFNSNASFLKMGLGIYFLIIFLWLAFEARLIFKREFRLNQFLAILGPAVLYAYCFLAAKNFAEIFFPLFLAHGIPYIAVMGSSLKKLKAARFDRIRQSILILVLTALAGGVLTKFYGAHIISMSNSYLENQTSPLAALLMGIYLVPLLSHFVFDGYIWKSKHRDAKVIFSAS